MIIISKCQEPGKETNDIGYDVSELLEQNEFDSVEMYLQSIFGLLS